MELRSSAFRPGGLIPIRHRSDGDNISPGFTWTNPPSRTQSLVLIFHDADRGTSDGFARWVVYNIDPLLHEIEEGTPQHESYADIGMQGTNDVGIVGYSGPPSAEEHRYIARLFALDTELDLKPAAAYTEVEGAMQGHILEQSALMGICARKQPKRSRKFRARSLAIS